MNHQTIAIFAQFCNAFKDLADPDIRVTADRIQSIMDGEFNAVTLNLLSKFISELFFEEVEPGLPSYVCLSGIKLPITSFNFLKELATGDFDLRSLAERMAMMKAGDTFPESFVPASILGELTYEEYENDSDDLARIIKKAVGGLVNTPVELEAGVPTELSLANHIPGLAR